MRPVLKGICHLLNSLKAQLNDSLKEQQAMYRDIWTWEKCKGKITTLRGRLGFSDKPALGFLKLTLSLETGDIRDEIRDKSLLEIAPSVYCILSGYADSEPTPETGKLISYSQLPGGRSYYNAFVRRAAQPIERTFGSDPQSLWKAARVLDGEKLDFGDCSVKIRSLPLLPIVIILHGDTSEFQASANMLFDSSASNFGSTEQLAMLGELTSARLRQAFEAIA